ncbi:hypothetical protein B0H21DRAFT_719255 [Amylocystis lapponica]|nr:hypothetical protein B0H21DRAFT_719255 [Amylocystis lapponica]
MLLSLPPRFPTCKQLPCLTPVVCGTMEDPPSYSDASHPFDNTAADIILCSSDTVHFHVHSIILGEASPFFKDMFALPQPAPPLNPDSSDPHHRDGHAIVRMSEDSHTLDSLLRLCYPITDPILSELQEVRAVLEASMKYQMEEATVLMTQALHQFALKEPLRVWAIACRFGLDDEAIFAAKNTLSMSLEGQLPEEMQDVTAGAYFRLLKYHRLRGAVSSSFTFRSPNMHEDVMSPISAVPYSLAYPFADILCYSLDGVELRVHRSTLALASPVLDRMVAEVEMPPQNLRETLAVLFMLCYRADKASEVIENPTIARAVLQAAMKFQMEGTIQNLCVHLTRAATSHPLRAYIIAAECKFDQCMRVAAKHMLDQKIEDVYVPEMETSPALPYHRLLKYHRCCCRAVSDVVTRMRHENDTSPKRSGKKGSKRSACASWAGIDLASLLSESVTSASWCSECHQIVTRLVDINISLGSTNIDKIISKVSMHL